MSELDNTGGANTGEAETSAVEQPVGDETTVTSAAAGAGELDADFIERLKTVDWNKVPADVRGPIEKPILSEFNRKIETQRRELETKYSDAQTRALQAIAEKLAQQTPAVPDGTAELLERAKAGDPEALVEYQQMMLQRNLEPIQRQQQLSAQYAEAARDVPELSNPEFNNAVGQAIQGDPIAQELFNRDGHRYAGAVIRAVAAQTKVALLQREVESMRANQEKAIRDGIEEHRRKVAGLPAKSTLAGSTPSGTPSPKVVRTMRDALPSKEQWIQMGGDPNAYD